MMESPARIPMAAFKASLLETQMSRRLAASSHPDPHGAVVQHSDFDDLHQVVVDIAYAARRERQEAGDTWKRPVVVRDFHEECLHAPIRHRRQCRPRLISPTISLEVKQSPAQ